MKKFKIYVGPELKLGEFQQKIGDVSLYGLGYWVDMFPEADMGAEDIRQHIHFHVKSLYPVVCVSRYSHYLSYVCELVGEKLIAASDVEVNLCLDGVWSKHTVTEDGVMPSTWPFGCLD